MEGHAFVFLYVTGAAAMVASLFLCLNTSTFSDVGGSRYERRRARRTAAITLFVVSLILFTLGLLAQVNGTGR